MILDDGICTVARKVNTASAGSMPKWGYTVIYRSWYGRTSFSTSARTSESRENSRVSARIRVKQNTNITNHDIVVLANVSVVDPDTQTLYEVVDAWHGPDDQNREPITNLTLEVMAP